jgi:hypothetical protein
MSDFYGQESHMDSYAVRNTWSGQHYLHIGEDCHCKDIFRQVMGFFEHLVQIITDDLYTFQYVITRHSFSYIFLAKRGEEKMSQLQQTITCGQSSLRMMTRRVQPLEWAGVHASLGEAYRQATHYADLRERYSGRSVMQEQALRHVEAALQVFTRHEYPLEWARMQRSLGMIYTKRVCGGQHENLARARDCYEAALQVCECSSLDSAALRVLLNGINHHGASDG